MSFAPNDDFRPDAEAKRWLRSVILIWLSIPILIFIETAIFALLIKYTPNSELIKYLEFSPRTTQQIIAYPFLIAIAPLIWMPVFGIVIYSKIKQKGLTDRILGFGIGSMVPILIVGMIFIYGAPSEIFSSAIDAGQGTGALGGVLLVILPIAALLTGGLGAALLGFGETER